MREISVQFFAFLVALLSFFCSKFGDFHPFMASLIPFPEALSLEMAA